LRRRRRHSTQIFRSTSKSTIYPQSSRPRKKGKGFLLFLFIVSLIVLSSYYLYEKFYYPQIKSENPDQISTTPLTLPAQEKTENKIPVTPPEKKVQVEILNGCGREGVAKIFQTYLQEQGYDVVNTDNYIENGRRKWDLPESMVIDQTGQPEKARAIASSLGISMQNVTSKPNSNALYDFSVVIGRDYSLLKAVARKNR